MSFTEGRKVRNRSAVVLLGVLSACSTHNPVTPTLGRAPASAAPVDLSAKSQPAPLEEKAPPNVVTSVTITFDQVSTELGVSRSRLETQARTLANYLERGSLPRNYCDDNDESNDKLCQLIERMRDEKGSGAAREARGRRVPIRPHHFSQQQGMGYSRLLRSMKNEPAARIYVWAPKMLATTSCPRNLSAVALRKLEGLLPSPSARGIMEKLYAHTAACLQPDDEGFEVTHFRQALLRHAWGDAEGAREAIRRAMLARESSEKPRVLYWAGRFESDQALKKKIWDRLVTDYPLSFHALEVWHDLKVDPYEIFSQRQALSLTRKADGQEDGIDESMRWLEALYIMGRVEAAQKLVRWISRAYRDELTPSNLLYISSLKSSRGTPLSEMTFLTRQIAENPTILNQQTLRLLFPKPYFEVFDRASPQTDTFLVLSVARQESAFNPRARSPANAQGLLQVLPSTARILSGRRRNNLYDTEVNAQLGVKYLSRLIQQFNGSVELALAGYNAGPLRVPEWQDRYPTKDLGLFLDLIPFKETRNYVSNILRNNYWYERLYRDDPAVAASRVLKKVAQRSSLVNRFVASVDGKNEIE